MVGFVDYMGSFVKSTIGILKTWYSFRRVDKGGELVISAKKCTV